MRRPILLSIDEPLGTEAADRALEAATRAGFDGVEGLLPAPQCPRCATVPGTNVPGVTVVRAGCSARQPEEAIAEVIDLLYRAADVGASCLSLTLPPVRSASEGVASFRYQDALTLAYKILRGARFDAEAAGVPLALEGAAGGCLLSPVELREIIDAAASWAVGACIDAARLAQVGTLDDWVTTLTHRVHATRLSAAGATVGIDSSRWHDELASRMEALATIPSERPVIVTDYRLAT